MICSFTDKMYRMKKLLALVTFIALTNIAVAQKIRKVKMDDVIKMIDTSSVPIIVNFWASWCAPCVHEIPWFEKAVAELKDKPVKVVLVSLDFASDYPDKLKAFVKEKGYQSTIVWLNETDANLFCPKIDSTWSGTIPATIMVNNKTHFKQFFGEQIPEPKFKLALMKLVE